MKTHQFENQPVKSGVSKTEKIKRRRRKTLQKILASTIILVIAIGLIALAFNSEFLKEFVDNRGRLPGTSRLESSESGPNPTSTPVPDLTSKVTIAFAGDIIMHDSLIEGGLRNDGSYNYNYMFDKIKDIVSSADYSIANFEGVLYGEPYSGWPYFNAPDEIASAIANSGFDMVTTANNHAYDKGMGGLTRTPGVFREQGVKVIGTRATTQDPKFELVDINGIKFAFSAYTYETEGTEENRALNAIPMHENANILVDSFNPYRDERFIQDKADIAQRARDMKAAGAQVVVFAMHWGDTYQNASNYWQQELTQILADEGVDIIFGCHPNIIQEISVVNSRKSDSKTLVYYSVGNLISNMTYDPNDSRTKGKVEDGIIARVEIQRDEQGNIKITRGEYISLYVLKEDSSDKRKHTIIPVKLALADPEVYGISGFSKLVEDSYKRTTDFLKPFSGDREGILIGEH